MVQSDVRGDRRALGAPGAALCERKDVGRLGVFTKDIAALEPERISFCAVFCDDSIFFFGEFFF